MIYTNGTNLTVTPLVERLIIQEGQATKQEYCGYDTLGTIRNPKPVPAVLLEFLIVTS